MTKRKHAAVDGEEEGGAKAKEEGGEGKAVLSAIRYERGSLELLDQLALPHTTSFLRVRTHHDGWHAINSMAVRGAPAIAIAAVLSVCVECVGAVERDGLDSGEKAVAWLVERLQHLKTARPTAVNLMNECDALVDFLQRVDGNTDPNAVLESFLDKGEALLAKDGRDNRALGKAGADAILATVPKDKKVTILTHCNTGSLACAQYGTALGVVRSLHEQGRLAHVYCTETRPYNQGARLTAFELVYDNIPATLICDSMAAYLMSVKGVDAVVVGADRVVANGDTANKIGTYQLAIAAQYHGVGFYVACPLSSIDLKLKTGSEIHIEERKAEELTHINGQRIAAAGIGVWNPAFDVAPASLITGLVTEIGVLKKEPGREEYDLAAALSKK